MEEKTTGQVGLPVADADPFEQAIAAALVGRGFDEADVRERLRDWSGTQSASIYWDRYAGPAIDEMAYALGYDSADPTPVSVTIYDVALARGGQLVDGKMSGGEFARLGLPMLSGCQRCHATLGPGNAHPSKTGFVLCGDCVADQGFATVAEFEQFERDALVSDAAEASERFGDDELERGALGQD